MKIDLFTLYLFSYAKEFLFDKSPEILKLTSFSDASRCVFIDEFLGKNYIALNPMEFFSYLKERDCFKINISKNKVKGLVLECSCRFSLEYWVRVEDDESDTIIFKKAHELLWVSRYRKISNDEVNDIRRRLKISNYQD